MVFGIRNVNIPTAGIPLRLLRSSRNGFRIIRKGHQFHDTRNKSTPFRHSCEGPDDMPAHIKACFLGSSLMIPITEGQLNLGTWQGIWLCEHRNRAGSRKVIVTINGAID